VLQVSANGSDGTASLTSITEYILRLPIFSFIVTSAAAYSRGLDGDSSSSDSEEETQDRNNKLGKIGIKLHTVHSK